MISFCLSVIALLLGYFFYSKFVERIFEVDPNRPTPAVTMRDDVDYLPMPQWKIFLIQFLNIAGLGPIFGAVAGAMWGPSAFLWIVLGSIFAGGVHDYFSGMLSIKHKGESITEITGRYLGDGMKQFMRAFTIILMIMVGAVFIMGPAKILNDMTGDIATVTTWVWCILVYYILSTVLPIDKLIGKLYPLFGVALLFMAFGLMIVLFKGDYVIPELTMASLTNMRTHPESFPLFPMLFVTIACGAISGFHASQSPMMARCMTNEKQGRSIFYGAMITEGVLALIWAAVSMSFFGGIRELNDTMVAQQGNAAYVVNVISNTMLGKIGGVLALLGVVAAPITSGDTAFRSARLIVADFTKSNQSKILNRLLISLPLFVVGFGLTLIDFGIVWRYFAWTNQTLATIVLWTVTVYLINEHKFYWVSLVPATFMTVVVVSYILVAPEGFSLSTDIAYPTGIGVALMLLIVTLIKANRIKNQKLEYAG
ncbi:carbon starvation CstA family protein [Pontibacter akesuensis]|uniref:Carbon starvation protein CstA n=1 Tax=Pontibacter akesuensis TaxID=388950 RepID=A0A1I7FZI5_9BACT|nr:carbon starvation protein A [Pontibacter akesuensis]GHA59726.1 carbon starvation protein CstA [Pontibacter akesuensis]SFU41567.1 Carbon starvation protein CstA [Pontibacter akesuensis]